MAMQEGSFPRYRFVIAALVAVFAFHNGLTAAISALFMSEMAADFGVSIGAMGLYMGLIGVAPILLFLFAPPLGYKIGFKRCAATYLIIKFVTLGGAALSTNYLVVCALKILEGGGAIFLSLSVLPILRTWFSKKSYGKLSSWVFGIPTSFGVMTFFAITPLLFPTDWRAAHLTYGGIAVGILIIWIILGRGPLVEPSVEARAKAETFIKSLRTKLPQVIRIKEVPLMGLWMFLGIGLGRAMTAWMPSYLTLEWGWTLVAAAAVMNVQNTINIVSSPVAGAISDKIGRRKPFLIMAGGLNCLSILMSINFVGPALWFWYGAFGLYTSLDGFTLNAILMEHPSIGYALFPYAMSVVTLVGTIGIFAMPTIVGVLLDMSGSLYIGLTLVALLNIVVVVIGFLIRETGSASDRSEKKPTSLEVKK